MLEDTNRLKLPLLVPNQSGKEFTHNEAMVIIDNLLQNHVISKTLNIPPLELNTGDLYIVAANGAEDWLNMDNQLAIFDNGWRFIEATNGMIFYVLDEGCFYVYKNGWIKLSTLIDFTQLKNIAVDNLQTNEVIKYDGNNFVNSSELNLSKLFINDKLLMDENLDISIKNNDELVNIVSINTDEIDFKNNIKIFGVSLDDYIASMVSGNIGISNIQSCIIPDYNSAIDITSSLISGYVAPANGVVSLNIQTLSNNGMTRIIIYINDVEVTHREYAASIAAQISSQFIVKKNDVIKATLSYSSIYYGTNIFCPFRTVIDNNNQGE